MTSSGIRDVSLTLAAQLASIITALGTQVLLARLLGAEGRGGYAACITFSTMLAVFCTFGRLTGAEYLLAAGKMNLSQAVVNALVYGGLGSLGAIAIGYGLMHLPIQFFERAPREAFLVSLLRIAPFLFSLGFVAILAAYRDFTGVAVFSTLNGVLQVLLMFLLIGVFSWDVAGGVGATVLAGALNMTSIMVYLRWRHGLTLEHPGLSEMGRMFSYGIRTYFAQISRQTNMQLGTLILAMSPVISQEDLGVFAAVVGLCLRIQVIPNAFAQVLMPRVAGDAEGRRELIAQCARVMFAMMGLVGLGLVVFARPVVLVAFGAEFLPGVGLLRVVLPGILLRSVAKMYTPYLRGTDRPGVCSVASFTALVLDAGLLVLLLPVLGLWGGAIAVAVSWGMEAVVLFVAFKIFSKLSLQDIAKIRLSDWRPLFGKLRRKPMPDTALEQTQGTQEEEGL